MVDDAKTVKRCVKVILNKFDYEKRELDTRTLNELESVVNTNETIIPELIGQMMTHLRRKDSDWRLAVVQLVNYFFQRFHRFRLELLRQMKEFLLRTLETDPMHNPLPPPAAAATSLKKYALGTVRLWVEKFANKYTMLQNVERTLSLSKNFDFQRGDIESVVERNRVAQKRFMQDVMARKILEKCHLLYSEHNADIQRSLIECRNLLQLVVPKFCGDAQKDDAEKTHLNDLCHFHGYDRDRIVEVVLPSDGRIEIHRDEDTADLLNTLQDSRRQLDAQLRRVAKWLKRASRAGAPSDSVASTSTLPSHATLVRRLLELRDDLRREIERCNQLRIDEKAENAKEKEEEEAMLCLPKKLTRRLSAVGTSSNGAIGEEDGDGDSERSENSDNDEDFIDVDQKEGLELDFDECNSEIPLPHHILEKIRQNEAANKQVNTLSASGCQTSWDSGVSVGSSASTRKDTTKQIPKLQFGLDLKYWGESVEPAEQVRNQSDVHRFWRASDTDGCDSSSSLKECTESYSSRMMTFVGKLPAIHRACRAPLTNGKLCPRMDRYRCPVHGEIVARDSTGQVVDGPMASERKNDESLKLNIKQNLNEVLGDDEFIRDLEGATGRSLAPTEANTRRNAPKKRKPSASVQLRQRLTTKLLDKRTIQRVTRVMDDMQKARAEHQFSHQFNYALNNHRS